MTDSAGGAARARRRAAVPGLLGALSVLLVLSGSLGVQPAGAATPVAVSTVAVRGTRASDVAAGSHPGNIGTSRSDSLDWSGYALTGHTFSSVSGSWTQPAVTCTGKKASQSAFWVGLDGFATTDPTVEQVGTDADCTKGTKKSPSTGVYYAWYELYPAGLVVLPTGTYAVTPDDTLSASVHVSGSAYTINLQDGTKWGYTTVVSTPTVEQNSSAEWIAESPSACKNGKCKPGPLADFGSVTFTGASADAVTLADSSTAPTPITMTTKKAALTLAVPSTLTGASGFEVTWLAP